MIADWFFARMQEWGGELALVSNDRQTSYAALLQLTQAWTERLRERGVGSGVAIAIDGSFSPEACGAFLAALGLGAVIVPLTPLMRAHREKFLAIAEVSLLIELDDADGWTSTELEQRVTNPLTLRLVERGHPGLVIFSSRSTGAPQG